LVQLGQHSCIAKKEGAEEITDFCPVGLIHTIAKNILMILAPHLGPLMNDLD
jgi:hypothetical protein